MASTGRTGNVGISFQNNCFLCLQPESPSTLLSLLQTNPSSLLSFQPVLHYLSGTDPTFSKSPSECKAKGLPILANLPPLCLPCYNLTSSIYRLHSELLSLQVQIQRKTEQVRKIVGSTKKVTHPPMQLRRTKRQLFLHRLRSSGTMSDKVVTGMRLFVEKLHDTIIEQGSNKVIFPSEPPPNFTSLPSKVPHPPEDQLISPPRPSSSSAPPPIQEEPPPISPLTSPPSSPPWSPVPIIISVVSNAIPAEKFENQAGEQEEIQDHQNNNEDDQRLLEVDEPPPPPVEVILKQDPQDNPRPSFKVINEDSSSDWEVDTQKGANSTSEEDNEQDDTIPKKKRKPSPPSPPQIFPAPLLQHQAAQILLHLSIPFLQKPPPPQKSPLIPSTSPIPPKKSQKNLPCEICNEPRPLNHLKPHLLAVHSGIQGHSCPHCQKVFISTSRLTQHWETREKCGKNPSILKNLQKFYTCLNCPSSPEKKLNLSEMKSHIFSSHERDTSLAKCFNCAICQLKFRTQLGLDFHINLHTHPSRRVKDEGKFREICPSDHQKSWRRKKKMEFFEKPNFNNLKVPCDQCQVNYKCRDLERHLGKVHGILKEELEKCEICLYRSTKKESLEKHMKICHKTKMDIATTSTSSKELESVEN